MGIDIVFETHSTSTDNEAGIATGWLEGELSEAGRHQAAELGARRRDDGVAAVFTSDLARAVQTAEVAFSGTGDAFLADLSPAFDGRRILVIGHAATRWSLDHLLAGADLSDLIAAPFDWREGWLYTPP